MNRLPVRPAMPTQVNIRLTARLLSSAAKACSGMTVARIARANDSIANRSANVPMPGRATPSSQIG
jgi:hypothetical protein